MYKLYFLIILLFSFNTIFSQQKWVKVVDFETKSNLQVQLFVQNLTTNNLEFTSTTGSLIKIDTNTNYLFFASTYEDYIISGKKLLQEDTIYLFPKVQLLDDIIVSAYSNSSIKKLWKKLISQRNNFYQKSRIQDLSFLHFLQSENKNGINETYYCYGNIKTTTIENKFIPSSGDFWIKKDAPFVNLNTADLITNLIPFLTNGISVVPSKYRNSHIHWGIMNAFGTDSVVTVNFQNTSNDKESITFDKKNQFPISTSLKLNQPSFFENMNSLKQINTDSLIVETKFKHNSFLPDLISFKIYLEDEEGTIILGYFKLIDNLPDNINERAIQGSFRCQNIYCYLTLNKTPIFSQDTVNYPVDLNLSRSSTIIETELVKYGTSSENILNFNANKFLKLINVRESENGFIQKLNSFEKWENQLDFSWIYRLDGDSLIFYPTFFNPSIILSSDKTISQFVRFYLLAEIIDKERQDLIDRYNQGKINKNVLFPEIKHSYKELKNQINKTISFPCEDKMEDVLVLLFKYPFSDSEHSHLLFHVKEILQTKQLKDTDFIANNLLTVQEIRERKDLDKEDRQFIYRLMLLYYSSFVNQIKNNKRLYPRTFSNFIIKETLLIQEKVDNNEDKIRSLKELFDQINSKN